MFTRRYMIVDHHANNDRLSHTHDGGINGQLCIHGMLMSYHWVRISPEHVFVFGIMSPHHYHALHNHEKVTVFPVIHSGKNVMKHIRDKGRKGHLDSLCNNFELHGDFSMADYLEHLEECGLLGPQFIPEI